MIPVSEPELGALERRYLLEAFDSGWISSRGAFIERAESRLREICGVPFAAVCSNGTTALHLALLAIGLGPGDEVILPSLSYVATLNAVYYVGATPVIVDVDEQTWCLDPRAVQEAVTDRTKAILAVDIYGLPADYGSLRAIADHHEIHLIADAAESIGATQGGAPTGSLADITTFSFFGNKVITSGEGGAITTSSSRYFDRILQLRNQGNHPTLRYHHDVIGYNYRMTNLSAAILTAQLERSGDLITRRRRVVDDYTRNFVDEQSVILQSTSRGTQQSPWMFSVRLRGLDARARDNVISQLSELGIETRPVFRALETMPFVPREHRRHNPVSHRISEEGISLPTYPGLESGQIHRVAMALLEALGSKSTGDPGGP